jgi:hypothetical protein
LHRYQAGCGAFAHPFCHRGRQARLIVGPIAAKWPVSGHGCLAFKPKLALSKNVFTHHCVGSAAVKKAYIRHIHAPLHLNADDDVRRHGME